jgi:menaquinone-dependent protoporphyrinogen oxidase
MRILVTYATRHGATRGIAERIAAALERHDLEVTLEPVERAGDPGRYDAAVIGSASYAFHWLGEASGYVRRNAETLRTMPVWLFSSGPLGTDEVDSKGRDVHAAAEPKEFAAFEASIRPRGTRVFRGAFDPEAAPVGVMERFMHAIPQAKAAMPAGDFREWPEIDAWAEAIATELSPVPTLAI